MAEGPFPFAIPAIPANGKRLSVANVEARAGNKMPYYTSDGINITRIVMLHKRYHGMIIMPKDKKNETAQQRAFWDTRRAMMKSQTKYDPKEGAKEAKAALKAQKDKK